MPNANHRASLMRLNTAAYPYIYISAAACPGPNVCLRSTLRTLTPQPPQPNQHAYFCALRQWRARTFPVAASGLCLLHTHSHHTAAQSRRQTSAIRHPRARAGTLEGGGGAPHCEKQRPARRHTLVGRGTHPLLEKYKVRHLVCYTLVRTPGQVSFLLPSRRSRC